MKTVHKIVSGFFAVGFACGLVGCGTPGAPQPPSLNLPQRVTDLSATRTGNQVLLAWTMPSRNTDKLLLKNGLTVRICYREGSAECLPTGNDQTLAPGTAASFTEKLPTLLTLGKPRLLTYFVEVKNRSGRSAGVSNAATVLAGQAPEPLTDLTAALRKEGVLLHWKATDTRTAEETRTVVRLHRKLLTATPKTKTKDQAGILAQPPEPQERNLLVEPVSSGAGASAENKLLNRALDKEVRMGQSYEYRAQQVVQAVVNGQTLELVSDPSAPVLIEIVDIFPPEVPTGLAAVATVSDTDTFIDLSWQPVTDASLAGYIVYRRENNGEWQRVSPMQPVVGAAFRDIQVLAGHTYHYRVSAIDEAGHESAQSAETQETVPTP
jgi:hypothetical protein